MGISAGIATLGISEIVDPYGLQPMIRLPVSNTKAPKGAFFRPERSTHACAGDSKGLACKPNRGLQDVGEAPVSPPEYKSPERGFFLLWREARTRAPGIRAHVCQLLLLQREDV